MSIEQTLSERGSRYGDFTDHAMVAQRLQDDMRAVPGWDKLDAVKRQALSVITDKIARILTGDPEYDDNWHDIQGYAKLVEDRLGRDRFTFEMNFVEPARDRAKEIMDGVREIRKESPVKPCAEHRFHTQRPIDCKACNAWDAENRISAISVDGQTVQYQDQRP